MVFSGVPYKENCGSSAVWVIWLVSDPLVLQGLPLYQSISICWKLLSNPDSQTQPRSTESESLRMDSHWAFLVILTHLKRCKLGCLAYSYFRDQGTIYVK